MRPRVGPSRYPALIGALLAAATVSGGELLTAIPGEQVRSPDEPSQTRARTVGVDVRAFDDALATGSLSVAFFDDARWQIEIVDVQTTVGGVVAVGTIKGDPHGSFIVARRGSAFAGDLKTMDGSTWTLRPGPGGTHVAAEKESESEAPCGGALSAPARLFGAAPRAPGPTESGEVLDIAIAWTREARVAAGGFDAMGALVDLAIARANAGYANSLVTTRVALVATAELGSYVDNLKTPGTVLNDFASEGDGLLEGIHALRDYHRADAATLIVDELVGACGIAYQMTTVDPSFAATAYNVVDKECVSNETFHHELGHNMGCHHDRANAGTVPFTYSYGWRWNGTSAGNPQYRSVMAFAPGTRVNHFSNPDVLYDGTPTGVAIGLPNEAHNAATLNATAPTVASYRISNDNFTARIVVDAARRSFITSTQGRTKEAGEPDHAGNAGGRSLWWSWTAPSSGTIVARTRGSGVDTVLAVYTGASVEALTPIASNDDAGAETWSEVSFAGTEGVSYQFAVDGKDGAQGAVAFEIFAGPEIAATPAEIAAQATSFANPPDAAVGIANAGIGTLDWSAASPAAWLAFDPASGSSTGEEDTVAVAWKAAGLADGIYRSDIEISSPGAGNSPQTIEATLEVLREPLECALVEVTAPNSSPGTNRGRGNVVSVNEATRLREIKASLSGSGTAMVRFNVLEGSVATGPFTGIAQKDVPTTLSATTALVPSGFMDVAMVPGKFYAIVASWDQPAIAIPFDGGNPTTTPFGTVHSGVSGAFPFGSYVGLSVSPTLGTNRYRVELCFDTGDPEIAVLDHQGAGVVNGGAALLFGAYEQGSTAPEFTFTVSNDGTTPLALAPVEVPAGFEVLEGLPESLAPSASDTFTLRMPTDAIGSKTGTVTIVNGDADEAPFAFTVHGVVQDPNATVDGWGVY